MLHLQRRISPLPTRNIVRVGCTCTELSFTPFLRYCPIFRCFLHTCSVKSSFLQTKTSTLTILASVWRGWSRSGWHTRLWKQSGVVSLRLEKPYFYSSSEHLKGTARTKEMPIHWLTRIPWISQFADINMNKRSNFTSRTSENSPACGRNACSQLYVSKTPLLASKPREESVFTKPKS